MYVHKDKYTFEMFNLCCGSYMHGVLREPWKNPAQEDEKMHYNKEDCTCTKFVSTLYPSSFSPTFRGNGGYKASHRLPNNTIA